MPVSDQETDNRFMRLAIQEARKAADAGEVPVGAIIVRNGQLIGRAHNQVELLKDPTAHAEIIALTQAAAACGDWRLTETTLYVTKEPCPMCAGAIVLGRVARLVFGVADPLRGGAVSLFPICRSPQLNHQPEIVTGVLEEECRALLQSFFRDRRQEARTPRDDIETADDVT